MKAKAKKIYGAGSTFPPVSLVGIKDEMWLVRCVVHDDFKENGYEAKITAGTEVFREDIHNGYVEEIHGYNSVHPFGYALDFSTEDIPVFKVLEMQTEIQKRLDTVKKGYEVIVHKTHIHMEYDKKVKGLI